MAPEVAYLLCVKRGGFHGYVLINVCIVVVIYLNYLVISERYRKLSYGTNIITEWENLTNRSVQINIPTTPVSREDLPLVALIIIAMAATIAAIVNQYAPGFGIYTYGAILAGWTGFSGIFWAPATIAGFMIALTVAKKIVG